jgi:hypothetical protein
MLNTKYCGKKKKTPLRFGVKQLYHCRSPLNIRFAYINFTHKIQIPTGVQIDMSIFKAHRNHIDTAALFDARTTDGFDFCLQRQMVDVASIDCVQAQLRLTLQIHGHFNKIIANTGFGYVKRIVSHLNIFWG